MINLKSCEHLNAIEILHRHKRKYIFTTFKKSNTHSSFSDWDSSIRFQRFGGSLGLNNENEWGKSI